MRVLLEDWFESWIELILEEEGKDISVEEYIESLSEDEVKELYFNIIDMANDSDDLQYNIYYSDSDIQEFPM